MYTVLLSSSAITVIVTLFSPSFKSVFPSTVTLAFSSSGTASNCNSVTSFPTCTVYSVTSFLNSGVNVPCNKVNCFNALFLDLSSFFSVVKYSDETYAVEPLNVTLLHPLLPFPVLVILCPSESEPTTLLLVDQLCLTFTLPVA